MPTDIVRRERGTSDAIERIRSVRAPRRRGPRVDDRTLTPRQREILDQLGVRFNRGFADLTMADVAAALGCSLRTLYGIAPSRDELVVVVIERNLRGYGRRAIEAVSPEMSPLEAIRAYLSIASFARDLDPVPAATATHHAHNEHLVEVTRRLLDLAVEQGEIRAVDTYALARAMAALGRDLAAPDVADRLQRSPVETADDLVEMMLRGLPR